MKEVYNINYVGERIMHLSFAFDIVGLKLKKLDDVLLLNNLGYNINNLVSYKSLNLSTLHIKKGSVWALYLV